MYFLIYSQMIGTADYITAHKSKKLAYLNALSHVDGANIEDYDGYLEDDTGRGYLYDSNPVGFLSVLIDWKKGADQHFYVENLQGVFERLINLSDDADTEEELHILQDELLSFKNAVEKFYKNDN